MVGLERGTVELSPYQTEWTQRYEEEVERLQSIIGDRVLNFEHVGSTAVEGLAAKPIIDLLAVIEDMDDGADLLPILEAHGYEFRPNDDVPDRLFLAKGPRANRTHYFSLTERDSDCYREQIAFRDYLRAHDDIMAEYESLKRELAENYSDDRASYTEEKEEFIERVLSDALDDG